MAGDFQKVKEVWRAVPSLTSVLASNLGRIMTAPHIGTMPNGGEPYLGVWAKDAARYILVRKYDEGKKTYKVSRLVCEAFHGRPKEEELYCIHINGNTSDNRAGNLKWSAIKENSGRK